MENKQLAELTQTHLNMLEKALASSQIILENAQNSNVENVVRETSNRDRIVKIVEYLQEKVTETVENLSDDHITKEVIDQLKLWQNRMSVLINQINGKDQEIIRVLESEKDDVKRKIAVMYKQKSQFQGYNLNNVQK